MPIKFLNLKESKILTLKQSHKIKGGSENDSNTDAEEVIFPDLTEM